MASDPLPEDAELVTVFETDYEPEAFVVQALLHSEGQIESFVAGVDVPADVLPSVGGMMIRVPAERVVDARAIIREYRILDDREARLYEGDGDESLLE